MNLFNHSLISSECLQLCQIFDLKFIFVTFKTKFESLSSLFLKFAADFYASYFCTSLKNCGSNCATIHLISLCLIKFSAISHVTHSHNIDNLVTLSAYYLQGLPPRYKCNIQMLFWLRTVMNRDHVTNLFSIFKTFKSLEV